MPVPTLQTRDGSWLTLICGLLRAMGVPETSQAQDVALRAIEL